MFDANLTERNIAIENFYKWIEDGFHILYAIYCNDSLNIEISKDLDNNKFRCYDSQFNEMNKIYEDMVKKHDLRNSDLSSAEKYKNMVNFLNDFIAFARSVS